MYDVYHIASKTDATITDTCDIRDPNSPFAAGHSRGTKSPCCRVRDALSQDKKKALHHLKWSISLFFLTQYVSYSQAWRFCDWLALQDKAWSTLQIIWETSQDYTTEVYRIECLNE